MSPTDFVVRRKGRAGDPRVEAARPAASTAAPLDLGFSPPHLNLRKAESGFGELKVQRAEVYLPACKVAGPRDSMWDVHSGRG